MVWLKRLCSFAELREFWVIFFFSRLPQKNFLFNLLSLPTPTRTLGRVSHLLHGPVACRPFPILS